MGGLLICTYLLQSPRSFENLPNTKLVGEVGEWDIFSEEEPVDEHTNSDGENVGSATDSVPDTGAASYTCEG